MTEFGSELSAPPSAGDLREQLTMLTVSETVRKRRSIRAFRPTRIPAATINEVLEEAQLSPSNCNTQPWVVHIASGAIRDASHRI